MSGYAFSYVPSQQIVRSSGFGIISFFNTIGFIVYYAVFIVGELIRTNIVKFNRAISGILVLVSYDT